MIILKKYIEDGNNVTGKKVYSIDEGTYMGVAVSIEGGEGETSSNRRLLRLDFEGDTKGTVAEWAWENYKLED